MKIFLTFLCVAIAISFLIVITRIFGKGEDLKTNPGKRIIFALFIMAVIFSAVVFIWLIQFGYFDKNMPYSPFYQR